MKRPKITKVTLNVYRSTLVFFDDNARGFYHRFLDAQLFVLTEKLNINSYERVYIRIL